MKRNSIDNLMILDTVVDSFVLKLVGWISRQTELARLVYPSFCRKVVEAAAFLSRPFFQNLHFHQSSDASCTVEADHSSDLSHPQD